MSAMSTDQIVELGRLRLLLDMDTARSIRQTHKLSLAEVAASIGVSPSTLHRWEAGQRTPRGQAALRYAELLARLSEPKGKAS